MELLDTSCINEFVSIKPPKISPKERNATLHPNEPKNFFPDLSWEYMRIKVDIDKRSLLYESGLTKRTIINNNPIANLEDN